MTGKIMIEDTYFMVSFIRAIAETLKINTSLREEVCQVRNYCQKL